MIITFSLLVIHPSINCLLCIHNHFHFKMNLVVITLIYIFPLFIISWMKSSSPTPVLKMYIFPLLQEHSGGWVITWTSGAGEAMLLTFPESISWSVKKGTSLRAGTLHDLHPHSEMETIRKKCPWCMMLILRFPGHRLREMIETETVAITAAAGPSVVGFATFNK